MHIRLNSLAESEGLCMAASKAGLLLGSRNAHVTAGLGFNNQVTAPKTSCYYQRILNSADNWRSRALGITPHLLQGTSYLYFTIQ